jgi:hypothetical protein
MIFAIFFLAVIMFYVIEIKIGSSVDVYHPEIGLAANFTNPSKLSLKQFSIVVLPFGVLICLCFLIS